VAPPPVLVKKWRRTRKGHFPRSGRAFGACCVLKAGVILAGRRGTCTMKNEGTLKGVHQIHAVQGVGATRWLPGQPRRVILGSGLMRRTSFSVSKCPSSFSRKSVLAISMRCCAWIHRRETLRGRRTQDVPQHETRNINPPTAMNNYASQAHIVSV